MKYLNQQSKSSSTDAATKEPILTREELINKYQACISAKRTSSDRDQRRSTEESLFGVRIEIMFIYPTHYILAWKDVCQMEKTSYKAYKRIGDCLKVSGFRSTDTYEDTLRKATSSFDDDAHTDAGTLIISMGRVANVHCRMENHGPWVATSMNLEVVGGLLSESIFL